MFERIVVGVDGSPAGFDALAQARRLLAPGGRLLAVTAVNPEIAVHAGFDASRIAARLWSEAGEAREQAERTLADLPHAEARLVHGRPIPVLLEAVANERADLLAVGTHGGTRAAGIVFGSVATAMLHDAPCAVLVARPAAEPDKFPRAIALGYDGSATALEAARAADRLGHQLGVPVRTHAATGGKPLTLERFPWREGLEWDERHPVDVLLAAARDADLLIVGSRGLHGLAALGSVSERAAHRAPCSVLVVRPTPAAQEEVAADVPRTAEEPQRRSLDAPTSESTSSAEGSPRTREPRRRKR
jgi:nucleotide-binding universal stress UspA family protein